MLKLVMVLAVVVVMAMAGGEVSTAAIETGHAMQNNDARLVAAYGAGTGE